MKEISKRRGAWWNRSGKEMKMERKWNSKWNKCYWTVTARKQGGAHELKNYIMVDNRGWPLSWKIYWSWVSRFQKTTKLYFVLGSDSDPKSKALYLSISTLSFLIYLTDLSLYQSLQPTSSSLLLCILDHYTVASKTAPMFACSSKI